MTKPAEPGDARSGWFAWRPMRPARALQARPIPDPVVEPLWSGRRIIAHVSLDPHGERRRRVVLLDDDGDDLGPVHPDVVARVERDVRSDDAVIDGVLTAEIGLRDAGTAVVPEVRASQARILMGGQAEVDVVRRDEAETSAPTVIGLAAVDLLAVDGTALLDVPLLERKRLLESVVSGSELLAVSVHTRAPIEPWVATWKSLGLRGGMLKAANSRYRPGDFTLEWRPIVTVATRR